MAVTYARVFSLSLEWESESVDWAPSWILLAQLEVGGEAKLWESCGIRRQRKVGDVRIVAVHRRHLFILCQAP